MADGSGRVAGTFRLPRDVTTGEHHVVVFGFGAAGEPVAVAAPVQVVQAGGTWLWPLVGIGAVLLLLSAGALLLSRRKPS